MQERDPDPSDGERVVPSPDGPPVLPAAGPPTSTGSGAALPAVGSPPSPASPPLGPAPALAPALTASSIGSPPMQAAPMPAVSPPLAAPGSTGPTGVAPSGTFTVKAVAPKGQRLRTVLVSALVGAIVAGGATAAALWNRSRPTVAIPAAGSAPRAVGGGTGSSSLDVHAVLATVGPSVVSVHTGSSGGEAAGSGIVLSADGIVLTNAHVIADATTIELDLADGRTVEARVLGAYPDSDVAVLRAEGLTQAAVPAELGSSDSLRVGDDVVAIGNALNLGEAPSVTTGIVSALNRSITAPGGTALDDLIQTDAAINPGNSGGPLVDATGRVVGMNTAIVSGAQNIGFALAIDEIRPIVEDLRAGRRVQQTRPLLGVETVDVSSVDPAVRARLGISTTSGAFVQTVNPGTAAASVGLRPGDVIVAVDGRRVRAAADVGALVRTKRPGDTVRITWERDGSRDDGDAKLGTR